MASNYSFTLELTPQDAATFAGAQPPFALCVQKTAVGGTPVQWLSSIVKGQKIRVSWSAEYHVFYTTSELTNGAKIDQDTSAKANPGKLYTYDAATFSETGSAKNGSSFAIKNGLTEKSTYGLACLGTVGTVSTLAPVVVNNSVVTNGTINFTPSEEVILYFSQDYTTNGTVVENVAAPSPKYPLKVNQPSVFSYNNGSFSAAPLPAVAGVDIVDTVVTALVTLTSTVAMQFFTAWIDSYFAKKTEAKVDVNTNDNRAFTVTVSGIPVKDATEMLQKLSQQVVKGGNIDAPVHAIDAIMAKAGGDKPVIVDSVVIQPKKK